MLAAVALVAGFLILRSISDGGQNSFDLSNGGASSGGSPADIVVPATTAPPVVSVVTSTTEPPLVTTGASVIVANANGIRGSAGEMTRTLQSGAGFQMVDPVDASSAVGTLDVSLIYYDAGMTGAQAVAESVVKVLGGGLQIAPLQGAAPTQDGTLGGAGVLLMLGTDKAGTTIGQLVVPSGAAPVATNPPVAGATPSSAPG
ncbi:MAG: LytR C-terminal domain-containing protein [Ilumatobacteraceae bacterium]